MYIDIWFIGVGYHGNKGPNGVIGPKGSKGEKGEKGDTVGKVIGHSPCDFHYY